MVFTAEVAVSAVEGDTVTFTPGLVIKADGLGKWRFGPDGNWEEVLVNPDIEHMTLAEIRKLIVRKDKEFLDLQDKLAFANKRNLDLARDVDKANERKFAALREADTYRKLAGHVDFSGGRQAELEKLRRFRVAVDKAYDLSEA